MLFQSLDRSDRICVRVVVYGSVITLVSFLCTSIAPASVAVVGGIELTMAVTTTMDVPTPWRARRFALVMFALAAASFLLSPSPANAQISASAINFPAHASSDLGVAGIQLSGVLYKPSGYDVNETADFYSAVVMMHGCGGMWSNQDPTAVNSGSHFALPYAPNLQNNLEKWGIKLAQQGIVALAVDSYTKRKLLPVYASYPANEWQSQCASNNFSSAGKVDPYTERVFDLLAGYSYLDSISKINGAKIASLGWSQGAQSTMLEAALTSPTSSATRSPATKFIRNVSLYPGCGTNLGFGSPATGYWQPLHDMHLHVGLRDGFYSDCSKRAARANTLGGGTVTVTFPTGYQEAFHSFDNTGSTETPPVVAEVWPIAKCATVTGNECAMRSADIDALAFLQTVL